MEMCFAYCHVMETGVKIDLMATAWRRNDLLGTVVVKRIVQLAIVQSVLFEKCQLYGRTL